MVLEHKDKMHQVLDNAGVTEAMGILTTGVARMTMSAKMTICD